MTRDDLDNIFTYHAPTMGQIERYARIRAKAKDLATLIIDITPDSEQRSAALLDLQRVVMLANAAIACHEQGVK